MRYIRMLGFALFLFSLAPAVLSAREYANGSYSTTPVAFRDHDRGRYDRKHNKRHRHHHRHHRHGNDYYRYHR
jgi:hypothetical protein